LRVRDQYLTVSRKRYKTVEDTVTVEYYGNDRTVLFPMTFV